ncbi:MAG: hypothetical protein J1F22_07720 [Lachnospiraceae bacterium]|nr:hypothetical protein [Lachnospiraceae bacterium]
MPLLNKDKMMNGFEKVVDGVNNAADKAGRYAKEKELDKKIDQMAHSLEEGVKDIGKSFKETFSGK